MARPTGRSARLLDFRSGGWVILLAVLLTGAAVGLRLADLSRSRGARALGDGKNVESYGFDLTGCTVPRATLAAAGFPKDGIRALHLPPLLRPDDVEAIAKRTHRKLLVSSDRVIGVVVSGHARAYPIRIMNLHEVVNDTLGARPIAVTYSPLCDAVVVFDRAVDGEVLRFGVSGLLYNSNLLMYDDRPASREESLWSQIGARAVAGPRAKRMPAAGANVDAEEVAGRPKDAPAASELTVLPVSVMSWSDWRTAHPETTVLAPDPTLAEEYRRNRYGSYFASDRLRFPAAPLPHDRSRELKTPMIAVRGGNGFEAMAIPEIGRQAATDGAWRKIVGGREILFRYRDNPPSVTAEGVDGGPQPETIYSFWFAWYAIREGEPGS